MDFSLSPDDHALSATKVHWLVRSNYLIRATSFAALFVAIGMHMLEQGYGAVAWGLLALQFLAYPHLVFRHARSVRDSLRTELFFLTLDALLVGIWAAALGFPTWIAFTMFIGCALNNATIQGWRGMLTAFLAYFGGALLWVIGAGFRHAPDTGFSSVALCMVGLTIYVLGVGNVTFIRNHKLRDTRKTLRQREQTLLKANLELEARLSNIQRLQAELQDQAIRDPLTGLYNRRYFNETLERELARAQRDTSSLCLMMIDLDHFKQVNDTHGHPAGDEILRLFGAMLRANARAGDIPCRYGGEEFLLLMPKIPLESARQRAEQLRAEFAARVAQVGEYSIQATLSIGIAAYPEHGDTPDVLTQAADLALYLAKQEGRNRVAVFAAS
ncbi:MAG: diguanylate cyclase [Betaproteobacteria bacterium]|nr:diguanylate cyclase [Betaproteobacteria bacterium]